jgi:hypothetical protein
MGSKGLVSAQNDDGALVFNILGSKPVVVFGSSMGV